MRIRDLLEANIQVSKKNDDRKGSFREESYNNTKREESLLELLMLKSGLVKTIELFKITPVLPDNKKKVFPDFMVIADYGGAIYNEFNFFLNRLLKLGGMIDDTREYYDNVIRKFKTGRNGLAGRDEMLKKFVVRVKNSSCRLK
jgi:hypothetical protein